MSADFSFLTLRNITAYQSDGARVPQNYILTTSSNGAGVFSNVISPSSVNASSIITSTLCANIMDVNILSTSVHIGNDIIASTITLQSYAAAPLVIASSINANSITSAYFPFINTSTITTGSINTTFTTITSSLNANSINANSITSNYFPFINTSTITTSSINTTFTTITSSLNANFISSNTLNVNYLSTLDNFIILDNNNSTVVMTGFNNDLYINGFPVLTDGNLSSISSLYWEDDYGQYTLAGGIFNKNLGQGAEKYMVGIGTNSSLNGTLSVLYSGGNLVGNSFHISSNNNYTYVKNGWDGANNGLALHLEENQATCCGPRVYLSKSYNFQSSIVGDLGAIKFTGTNPSQSSILGAEITAQQTGLASTFVPTDILFINGTSSVSNTNMIIKDSGNIGIGISNPRHKLDVNGGIFSNSIISVSTITGPGAMRFFTEGGYSYIETGSTFQSGIGNTLVITNIQDTLSPPPFVVDTVNSRVGIKNLTPTYTLDVGGTIAIC